MKKLTENEKNLVRRYLTWCYKTTKEELDKVDRYFTQLLADDFILKELKKFEGSQAYQERIKDFKQYRDKKEENVVKKKFINATRKELQPDYQYRQKRFLAIEKAIVHFLGQEGLKEITALYEQEMTHRILHAREH